MIATAALVICGLLAGCGGGSGGTDVMGACKKVNSRFDESEGENLGKKGPRSVASSGTMESILDFEESRIEFWTVAANAAEDQKDLEDDVEKIRAWAKSQREQLKTARSTTSYLDMDYTWADTSPEFEEWLTSKWPNFYGDCSLVF
jgi:hypothetical protein